MLHVPSVAAPFDKIVYRHMYNAASAQALVFGLLLSGNAIWPLALGEGEVYNVQCAILLVPELKQSASLPC